MMEFALRVTLLTITVNKLCSNENDALRLAEQAGLDLVLAFAKCKTASCQELADCEVSLEQQKRTRSFAKTESLVSKPYN